VIRIEEKNNHIIEKAKAYRNLGNAYALKNRFGRALFYLNQALKIFEDQSLYRKASEVYFDLGKLNYDMEDYERAIIYANKLLNTYDEYNDEYNIASPLEYAIFIGLTGSTYREQGDYELAKPLFKKYIKLSMENDFPYRIDAIMILSLASTYELNIGYLKYKKGNIVEAIPLLRFAIRQDIKEKALLYANSSAINLGDAYLSIGENDSALFYYNLAMSLTEEFYEKSLGSFSDTSEKIVFGGYQYFFNMNEAEIKQLFYRYINNSYNSLYDFYIRSNDTIKAFIYLQKKFLYLDSLNQLEREIELYRIQERYENNRLEAQVGSLLSENELNEYRIQKTQIIIWAVVFISLLTIVIGVFVFRQNRNKTIHEKLLVEQRLLRSQMNPHFIFNSLASVQNFIVKQDDTKASIYLSRFSELVRGILENSRKEWISVEIEISIIDNYLSLQKIRFPDEFDYNIDIDEGIDTENIMIPPMLIQPFLENAIDHGIKYKETKGNVQVSFIIENKIIIISIEDDGIGRKKAMEILKEQNRDHKSLATVLTKERIAILNNKLRNKIRFDIIDLLNDRGEGIGTRVIIGIPNV